MDITKACQVPPDARVYDYDELDRPLQYALPALTRESGCSYSQPLEESSVSSGDYIKFTAYYKVHR